MFAGNNPSSIEGWSASFLLRSFYGWLILAGSYYYVKGAECMIFGDNKPIGFNKKRYCLLRSYLWIFMEARNCCSPGQI
jgi:hypothetical protein